MKDSRMSLNINTNPAEDDVSSQLFTSSSWEIYRLSIAICFAQNQFTFLQSVLHNNRKTILSLTIICHSTSAFLANV